MLEHDFLQDRCQTHTDTFWRSVSSKPVLASCSLDSPSPISLILSILKEQAETLCIFFDTICQVFRSPVCRVPLFIDVHRLTQLSSSLSFNNDHLHHPFLNTKLSGSSTNLFKLCIFSFFQYTCKPTYPYDHAHFIPVCHYFVLHFYCAFLTGINGTVSCTACAYLPPLSTH